MFLWLLAVILKITTMAKVVTFISDGHGDDADGYNQDDSGYHEIVIFYMVICFDADDIS